MKKELVEKTGLLALFSFVLIFIGLTFVEVYSNYYSLDMVGWIMLIVGVIGLVSISIYSKVKKLNLPNYYATEKFWSWWSIIIFLSVAFWALSYAFGGIEKDYMLIRMYVGGFGSAFIGLLMLLIIFFKWIKKE